MEIQIVHATAKSLRLCWNYLENCEDASLGAAFEGYNLAPPKASFSVFSAAVCEERRHMPLLLGFPTVMSPTL